jgi:DNA repair protein RecN (Recombination protein N)
VSVPLTLLRDVGTLVVDIHGQHEFQSLTRPAAQRELLDDFGKHVDLAGNVRESHKIWVALVNRTAELEGKNKDRDARIEMLRFQVSELKALDLKEGEIGRLSEERTRHSNRGRLAEAAQTAVGLLYDSDEGNAHATASRALAGIKTLSGVDPRLAKVVPMVDEATIQIREAARELSRYLETLDVDPARQEEVERRLAAIEELSRKHRVPSSELVSRAAQVENELAELESADSNLNALKKQQAEALDNYRKLAVQLSLARRAAAKALAKDIETRMQTLGMSGGKFLIDVSQPGGEPSVHGVDVIEFRVTANQGQPPRPLAKVASGGELSRLSLAVQVACSAKDSRCMIFDEVDSGVGGAVAEIVGRELKALGYSGQTICVTHLAQVASQGHHQLRVSKLTDGKTTRTTLAELTMDERVEEVARMLGGREITDKAREHAREMLHLAGNPEQKARGTKRKA